MRVRACGWYRESSSSEAGRGGCGRSAQAPVLLPAGKVRCEHAQTLAPGSDERGLGQLERELGARSGDLPGCRYELLRVLQPHGCVRITGQLPR